MSSKKKRLMEGYNPVTIYPTLWLLNALEHDTGRYTHLCICGYSRRVGFMGHNLLTPFVMQSIDIIDGECFNSECCLDIHCKYNRTTPESYAISHNLSSKETMEVMRAWESLIKHVNDANHILSEDVGDLLEFTESKIMQGPEPLIEWIKP